MSQVSVIIPNFNNAFWLPQCLESCLIQGEEYLKEIIVVDDHSEDESWEILAQYQHQYPGIVKIFKNNGKGGNLARNYGLSHASGSFIQWLDSDDFILPGKFAAQVTALNDTNKDVAYSDWRLDLYNNKVFRSSEKKTKENYADFLFEILKDNWNPPNAYLLRRKIADSLIDLNGWNPETRVGQDREYFTKAAISGAEFLYVPGEFAVYNRWSKNTVSHMNFKERLKISHKTQYDFALLIKESVRISEKHKKKYLAVLNTQAIVGSFYNSQLELRYPFDFFNLNWDLINWKLRPFIPFIYLIQKIRFIKKTKY